MLEKELQSPGQSFRAMGREVELHRSVQAYICEFDWDIAWKIKKCYTDGTEVFYEWPLVYPKWIADYLEPGRESGWICCHVTQ